MGIQKYLQDDIELFVGENGFIHSYWKYLSTNNNYDSLKINFLNYVDNLQLDEQNYSNIETWNISESTFTPRTVIYSAIQIAVYMGFNEIILLGCDHDYLLDICKRITNHHFYEESIGFSDADHLSQFTTERWFFEYYMRWKQYRLMKEFLDSKDVSIYNATRGGMLDVFPRIVYEDITK